jgi:hypothetical protein
MSPPKPKKAASRKPARKGPAKRSKGTKAPRSSRKAAKPSKAARSTSGSAKPTASATGHAHCAATDPFGGTCQNLPRRPSKYCVIHSYLER